MIGIGKLLFALVLTVMAWCGQAADEPLSLGHDAIWNPKMARELAEFSANRNVAPLALAGAREVDLLVWVPDWADPYPGYGELESMVASMVTATNSYMENSQVAVQLRLRGIIPLSGLAEQGSADPLVTDFSQSTQVDDALNLYYGADLAMLLVPAMDDAAGIAFLPGRHSVVSYQGLPEVLRNAVAAHEIGHNFGAGHEGDDAAAFPYSHAIDCGFGRTVMWSFVSFNTLPSYSSPLLGEPLGCGDAQLADNGRTLNELAEFIGGQAVPPAEVGVMELEASPASVTEGDSVELGISRSQAQGRAAATLLVSDGGDERLFAVTFAEGVTRTSVSLLARDDGVEANRTLTARLRWPAAATLGRDSHSVQVIDNSVGSAGTVVFAQPAYQVSAGEVLAVRLNRQGGSSGALTVQLQTVEGSALAGRDYTALDQSVTFSDGQASRTVNLVTFDQGAQRSLTLRLTAPGNLVSQASVELVPPQSPSSGGGSSGGVLGWWGLTALLLLGRRRRR